MRCEGGRGEKENATAHCWWAAQVVAVWVSANRWEMSGFWCGDSPCVFFFLMGSGFLTAVDGSWLWAFGDGSGAFSCGGALHPRCSFMRLSAILFLGLSLPLALSTLVEGPSRSHHSLDYVLAETGAGITERPWACHGRRRSSVALASPYGHPIVPDLLSSRSLCQLFLAAGHHWSGGSPLTRAMSTSPPPRSRTPTPTSPANTSATPRPDGKPAAAIAATNARLP